MKWQDNCTNPWTGVDDAGCSKGCLHLFIGIVAIPSAILFGIYWYFT